MRHSASQAHYETESQTAVGGNAKETEMNMFTDQFGKYVCVGDSIECEVDGYTVMAHLEHDPYCDIDDDDHHNPDQSVTGCDDTEQEKLLAARHAWERGEWFYGGIVLSVSRNGIMINRHAAALWGIECNYPDSDNSYLWDVANELLPEALERAGTERQNMLAKLAS